MSTSNYIIKVGDKFSPFTGQPLNYPIGTVIYGDLDTKTDYGTSPTAPTGQEDYNKSGDTPTSLYGQTERNSDWETPALQTQRGIVNAAEAASIINSNFLKSITSDPSIVSFYVNALAYGGYTIGDILNDIKRRELISQGNTNVKSLKIIDPELDRNTYQSTAEGQKSVTDASTMIPTFNFQGLLNPDILKYGANIPDELFKTLVPILDKNSQEFKDAVAEVKATYYDLATSALQATTEQEKAIADYNLKNFKEQINQQYGIALSDDATKAWAQIEDLENSMNTRGLAGSGMEAESIDNILASTRKQDQRLRQEKLTKEEAEKASYYTTSASAAEIATLTPEERQKYGLTPSSEILSKFSIEALKTQYPNKTDAEIKAIHDAVIDENGNYRSTLYSKYYSKIAETAITNQTNAENQVLLDAQNKEDKAYRNYDQSQPFSVATQTDDIQTKKDAQTSTQSTGSVITPTITSNPVVDNPNVNNYNSLTGKRLAEGETYVNAQGQTIKQGTPLVSASSSNMSNTISKIQNTNPVVPKTNTPTVDPNIAKNKQLQIDLNNKNAGQPGWIPLVVDGIIGAKTKAAQTFKPTTTTNNNPYGLKLSSNTTKPKNSGLTTY